MNVIEHLSGKTPWGSNRSRHWPEIQKIFLADNPECVVCGARHFLNVHHVKPFHLFPELELVPANLITLCRGHHFIFGHLMNWKSWNASVAEDSRLWKNKILSRP